MASATDPVQRGRTLSGIRRSLAGAAMVSLAGCSFLLDFPTEQNSQGGAGGAGGSGAGGQVEACFGDTDGPTSDEITWLGIPKEPQADGRVTATGLAYDADQQELLVFGATSDGLQDYEILEGQAAYQVYAVSRFDSGVVDLLFAGHACTFPWSNRDPTTRRIATVFGDLYGGGSLPTDEFAAGVYSFSGETEGCGQPDQVQYSTIDGNKAGPVPVLYGVGSDLATPVNFSDGGVLDVAATFETRAWLGAARGNVLGTDVADTAPFLRVEQSSGDKVVVAPSLLTNTKEPLRSWPGAVTIDGSEKVWFGGSSCAAASGCDDPELTLATFAFSDEAPTVLEQRSGGTSAITSLRYADGRVVVGGHYRGTVSLLGTVLPEAANTVPFVAAIDATTNEVTWTWPSSASSPDLDTLRGVVDMAISGDGDCGAVYVLGCASPMSVGYRDCYTIEPGKTSFLSKLDLATGAEVWSNEVELATVFDTFIPSAITSADDRVWVAATFLGAIDAWGQHFESGASREAVVLRIAP